MPLYALLLAYDGSDFAGWWRQPGERTVAGTLDEAFRRIGEGTAGAVGASRTDAGVHARGQVAHVTLSRSWQPAQLRIALAAQLPPDLACRGVAAVPERWHATHDACAKTYSYRLDNGAIADPFLARTAWRPPYRLRLAALSDVASSIPGQRDWNAFLRRGDAREDTVRTISGVDWCSDGPCLVCRIAGDGFIYRLVRSLVGSMVAVANGGCSAEDFRAALAGRANPASMQQAPARGLCLEQVDYHAHLAWADDGLPSTGPG